MSRPVGEALSDEEIQSVVEPYREHNGNAQAAAVAMGMALTSFRRRLSAAAKRGLLGTKPVIPTFEMTKVSSQLDGDGNVTSESIQQKPEIASLADFEVGVGRALGKITSHVKEGKVVQEWVRTSPDDVTLGLIEALKDVFDKYEGRAELSLPPRFTDEDLLSAYIIADQHNGLLAWGKETGEAYDLKIGEARLRECMARLVSQAPRSAYGLVVNLGDYQHTDDQKNMTPGHGNLLDVDSRYFKILTTGVKLMQDCIEMALQKHGEVLVVNIPGNHDPHASIALTVALAAFYRNDPRVTIYDKPADWFFHRFGNTLMGATHGHRSKPVDMAMTMACRCAKDWGETKYHVMWSGHVHHESAKEIGNVRVESFQTLAANDAWHHAGGYCSGKSLTSITFHRQDGEIGRHRVNVPAPDFKAVSFDEREAA